MNKPELATDSRIAASILYVGMQEGWFTGKKLAYYFKRGLTDAYNARCIMNGLDRAGDVAGYYHKFVAALTAARVEKPAPIAEAPTPPPPDTEPPPVPVPQPAQPSGFF